MIATGTPGGVGYARERRSARTDVIAVTIDGIGEIRDRFVAGGQS
jgi:2-keto-4-pentenoate hydratase/2-oxohepta-3-ene-1,7-dioic acid hydratase in catechol pathway